MFRKISVAALLCVSLFAARAGMTQQPPVSVLLENVREPANYVAKFIKDTEIRPAYADAAFERARQAIEAVDRALAAGVPAERTVDIEFEGEHYDTIKKPMTLVEIRAMCERVGRVAGKDASLKDAAQAATNASYWPGKISQGEDFSGPNARVAADAANECISAIDKALASGNLESTRIEVLNNNKLTLSEAREMCVYVRAKATKQVSADVASEEAEYEPFRKVLSGDKLNLYNDRLKKYKLYGAGGKVLKTPEAYRDSPLWCTTGVDREGIVPVWSVDCWHFKGMKMVGSVESRTGTGDEAPSSAFR